MAGAQHVGARNTFPASGLVCPVSLNILSPACCLEEVATHIGSFNVSFEAEPTGIFKTT